jgi:hypothetical protein
MEFGKQVSSLVILSDCKQFTCTVAQTGYTKNSALSQAQYWGSFGRILQVKDAT